jgi:lactate dehydrogenase-like 2-hydroxyacid dehydrogenase
LSRPKLFLTRRWPHAVETYLRTRYDVVANERDEPLPLEALHAAAREHEILCPTVTDRLPASVFEQPGCKVRLVCNYGVGYEHIDVAACKARGIVVTNTPDVLTESTAELAILLMLAVARRAGEGERELRAGRWAGWRPTHLPGAQMTGKTLGLVGFGRIGRATAAKAAHGFGMKILYHSRRRADASTEQHSSATHCPTLDELLAASDFVSLHCPGGSATEHLIDAAALARMKPSAFLINTARGSVVDEAALARALREKRIAGAGLDVYRREPLVPDELKALENVVLLPHLGSATAETRVAMGMRAAENLECWLAGRDPPDRVA